MTSFEPTAFVLGVTWLFALATLATGILALVNSGDPFLVDTGLFQRVGRPDVVRAPNARGWGARQVATGVTLWPALLIGDPILFQVGLAGAVLR
jgi:hypothetical protein